MPFIDPDDGLLAVFNIFETDLPQNQERVVEEMRDIVDNADYPGWISSSVHAAVERPGTANLVQWRSLADLQARYSSDRFRKGTVPLFRQLATSVRLLQTEAVFAQRHADLEATEIALGRDDHTVIVVLDVDPANQQALLDELAKPDQWLRDEVPGYRSHTYFRSLDGSTVVNFAQWASRADYDRFHTLPEERRPADVAGARRRAGELVTARSSNGYRLVHSRTADTADVPAGRTPGS
ncbi:antibiotic biosynthesis monooxygenase family protein [Pseudonocardia nematodicida]|uniref:Antibiotic biosynthesis monooxygenase family protein n=1 Tax=Pseudonocardia nematodicida TaxID=1206997 RepID=A0ABV1KEB1_9PSEU